MMNKIMNSAKLFLTNINVLEYLKIQIDKNLTSKIFVVQLSIIALLSGIINHLSAFIQSSCLQQYEKHSQIHGKYSECRISYWVGN